MPLNADFTAQTRLPINPLTGKRRAAPFSLRLTETEKARLREEAKGVPLGPYIKAKALGAPPPPSSRRTGLPVADGKALAQTLALLGRSHLSSNLNQLAKAVHFGILPVTPETEADLREACLAVLEIRRLLISALGLSVGGKL